MQEQLIALSEFVRQKRKSLRMTQKEMSEKSGVGIRFIRELERGANTKDKRQSLNKDDILKQIGAEKWFGNIPGDRINHMQIPEEPKQTSRRFLEIEENVPLDSVYKAFHMPGRKSNNYYSADLLSDLLGRGKSSRLYQNLVKNDKVFNSINSYVTGTEDPGLLIISGKVNPDIDIVEAEKAIEEEINSLKNSLEESEVEKVINQAISSTYFSEAELLNRSINLSVANSMGNTNLVNEELELIGKVKKADILDMADEILKPQNCSTLYYKSEKK